MSTEGDKTKQNKRLVALTVASMRTPYLALLDTLPYVEP